MNRDAFLTRAQAAKVAAVHESAIGNWRARGWLDPTGKRRQLTVKRTASGRLLYRLGDILDAERDTGRNPSSHRVRGIPKTAG